MMILALEFSSDRRSVAVARGEKVLAEAFEQTAARGTNVFGLIENVLAEAKIGREEVEAIAVGLGPGSYTGIRAAIAVAQGWQLARGVRLTGVSSAAALAAQAQAAGIFGRVNVALDAQRGEFYLAAWEISETKCALVTPLKIVTAAELAAFAAAGEILIGPEKGTILFPAAAMVARLAARQTVAEGDGNLTPIYLREANFVKAGPSRLL